MVVLESLRSLRTGQPLYPTSVGTQVPSARRGSGKTLRPSSLFRRNKISMKRLARSVCLCAHCLHGCKYPRMYMYSCVHVLFTCLCMHVPALSVHVCLHARLCVCARALRVVQSVLRVYPGRAGLPRGPAPTSLQFFLTHKGLRTLPRVQPDAACRALAPRCGGAGKGQAPKRGSGAVTSRAFLGQPPRSDLGRRAGRGRQLAGRESPACPFNPAARREHVSRAPGGTRAPPPPRQLYCERCLWPAARRLGSTVRLASLLLILFL